jgi:hypothetical protein
MGITTGFWYRDDLYGCHDTSLVLHPIILNTFIVATLALGSRQRQGFAKSAGQERDSGVWESVRMNIHTPKWTPILGVGVPMDSWNFREWLQGSKPFALRNSLYNWKATKT